MRRDKGDTWLDENIWKPRLTQQILQLLLLGSDTDDSAQIHLAQTSEGSSSPHHQPSDTVPPLSFLRARCCRVSFLLYLFLARANMLYQRIICLFAQWFTTAITIVYTGIQNGHAYGLHSLCHNGFSRATKSSNHLRDWSTLNNRFHGSSLKVQHCLQPHESVWNCSLIFCLRNLAQATKLCPWGLTDSKYRGLKGNWQILLLLSFLLTFFF